MNVPLKFPRDYIWHADDEANAFINEYFTLDKNVLFLGSVGFDPRTLSTYSKIRDSAKGHIRPVFFLEDRPEGSMSLKEAAEERRQSLASEVGAEPTVRTITIFAEDGAPVGGRRLIENIEGLFTVDIDLKQFTDIVVDICAMSRGIFFPLIRYLRGKINELGQSTSLHIVVIDQPAVDYSYLPLYHDKPDFMHGFDGGVQRVGGNSHIRLWLPQLVKARSGVYDSIHTWLKPDDVCPVLPFPGISAKMVDELVVEYQDQIQNTWNTVFQNIALAAESDPLDFYHAAFRVHSARRKIFPDSFTILSPMGSKVSTIGGLLAAMDLDLPVAFVETLGYTQIAGADRDMLPVGEKLLHVWVDGPIYPQCQQS